jgi:hypothetical protein
VDTAAHGFPGDASESRSLPVLEHEGSSGTIRFTDA